MKIIALISFILCTSAFAVSRAPAVEPFVEIHKDVKLLNQKLGPIAAFNFKPKALAKQKAHEQSLIAENYESSSFTLSSLLLLLALITLPFVGWQFIMLTFDKKAQENKTVELKIISKYDESESVFESKDDEEHDHKKAA